jgi:hypothetical protein
MDGALVGVGSLQASCDNLTSKANIVYKFQNTKNFIFLINLQNLKSTKFLEFVFGYIWVTCSSCLVND